MRYVSVAGAVVLCVLVVSLCGGRCGGAAGAGGARGGVSPLAARAQHYSVESTVLAAESARRAADTGFKLRAALALAPVWSAPPPHHELLLQYNLHGPKLYLRHSKHPNAEFVPHASVWDDYHDTPFYAHWKNGIIESIYLEPDEPVDFANYKKSLVSLFQFRLLDGEYNETDISGDCNVLYESLSENVIRKFKRSCVWQGVGSSDAARAAGSGGGEEGEALLLTRRLVRVELAAGGAGGVAALLAEDVAAAGRAGAAGGGAGVKLRAWHRLAALPDTAAAPPAPAASLRAALPPRLRAHTLVMQPDPAADADAGGDTSAEALAGAVEAAREWLAAGAAAGGGGAAGGALAALRLLRALRAATREQLASVLASEDNQHILPGLLVAAGAAGTAATHAAASGLLQLHAPQQHAASDLTHTYLEALVPAQESVVWELVKLSQKRRELASAALLAAARARRALAAAGRERLRDHLVGDLARCKESQCRVVRVRALGVLREAGACSVLVQQAAGADAAAAEEALESLGALARQDPLALDRHALARLHDVVLALHHPASLEVRAAALDVLLRAAAVQAARRGLDVLPVRLGALAGALAAHGPPELRRLLWHTLDDLAAGAGAQAKAVRAHVRHVRRDQPAWLHHYYPGTSSVLSRWAGRGAGAAAGWSARLRSRQVARGGLLRAGVVTLSAVGPAGEGDEGGEGAEHELLSLRIWARGLSALAGSGGGGAETDGEGEGAEEEAAAGLVAGALGGRGAGAELFRGQAALLAALWAGAGSEPTPVLRALPAPPPLADTVPLCVGVPAKRWWEVALDVALDASVSVSLWSRTARAAVSLRGAGAARAACGVSCRWARAGAESLSAGGARLRIHADLDFYEEVTLCVRAHTDDTHFRDNVTLHASDGGGARAVRRLRAAQARRAGSSLALGADNHAACRRLQPQDGDFAD